MASDPSQKPKYPGTASDASRLRAQHDLVKNALGGLILCPLDLTKPNLRILDSGTADGTWLVDASTSLADPDSATLIGTDIGTYAPLANAPSNLHLSHQDFLKPWPESWTGTFDLVHARATMSSAGTRPAALSALQRLLALVKPGGYLQIVDSWLPLGSPSPSDPPYTRVMKHIGQKVAAANMDPELGRYLPDMFAELTGIADVQVQRGVYRIGRGAPEEVREAGEIQMRGLAGNVAQMMQMAEDRAVSESDVDRLEEEMRVQAAETGIEQPWVAVWGRRVQE